MECHKNIFPPFIPPPPSLQHKLSGDMSEIHAEITIGVEEKLHESKFPSIIPQNGFFSHFAIIFPPTQTHTHARVREGKKGRQQR
jgi:hypothetical protein